VWLVKRNKGDEVKGFTLLVVGMLSVFVIACGGSGSASGPEQKSVSPSGEPKVLTKAEFRAQANEVCRRFATRVDDMSAQMEGLFVSDDPDAASRLYDVVSKTSGDLTDELAAIEYDGEGSKEIQLYVETMDGIVAQFKELRDDPSGLFEIADEINRLNRKTERIVQKLGLDECAFPE
jgi:hypothetical protein